MDLNDDQWEYLKQFIPNDYVAGQRGRPPPDLRSVLNGILWILRTGAPWKDLPRRYGAKSTVHSWFQYWVEQGVLQRMMVALAQELHRRGKLNLSEAFIDGTFSPAKKGGPTSERPRGEKAPKSWPSQMGMVFLSPFAQQALRQQKCAWSDKPLKRSASDCPSD